MEQPLINEPASLFLCATQHRVSHPYQFKLTNVKIYSIEEALYHSYNYWKESLDDIASPEFAEWVANELGLSHIAAKIGGISADETISERMIKFLSVTDYYDEDDLEILYGQLREWEGRLEWERLKDRADFFNAANQPIKAYPLYRRALIYGENVEIFNNIGICLMKMNRHNEAVRFLQNAHDIDKSNNEINKNLVEACIYGRRFEQAASMLSGLEKNMDGLDYLYGELEYEKGNILQAARHYEAAAANGGDIFYKYRLAEIYVRLRFFDKALEVMDGVTVKDEVFLMKQSDIYARCNNIPAAVKCIERALVINKNNMRLWIKLASFHRMNYDNSRAEMSIRIALDIDPENEEAMLENARIKKLSGKTRDYQNILKQVLQNFKKRYREINTEINA